MSKIELPAVQEALRSSAFQQALMSEVPEVAQAIEASNARARAVLLVGEKGTEKSTIAKIIHESGARAGKPFRQINPDTAEDPSTRQGNELRNIFGQMPGAFSSGGKREYGCFDRTPGGTIFFSGIEALSPKVQMELRHVIRSGNYFPRGGTEMKKRYSAHIIASTRADVDIALHGGDYLADLVEVFPAIINIPPFRNRKTEAKAALALNFIDHFSNRKKNFSMDAFEWIFGSDQKWPGNIIQLAHVIQLACSQSHSDEITAEDLKANYSEDPKAIITRPEKNTLQYPENYKDLTEEQKAKLENEFPESVIVRYAMQSVRQEDWESIIFFETLLLKNEKISIPGLKYLAKALEKCRRIPELISIYEKILILDPDDELRHRKLAKFRQKLK